MQWIVLTFVEVREESHVTMLELYMPLLPVSLEALSSQVLCMCLSVYEYESISQLFISWVNAGISVKLITVTDYQVYMKLMASRRSLGQRSLGQRSLGQRSLSASDGHWNVANSTAAETLNGLASKLTQIRSIVRPRSDYVFKVMSLKVKVTENIFQKYGQKQQKPIDRKPSASVKLIVIKFSSYEQ